MKLLETPLKQLSVPKVKDMTLKIMSKQNFEIIILRLQMIIRNRFRRHQNIFWDSVSLGKSRRIDITNAKICLIFMLLFSFWRFGPDFCLHPIFLAVMEGKFSEGMSSAWFNKFASISSSDPCLWPMCFSLVHHPWKNWDEAPPAVPVTFAKSEKMQD